MDSTNSNTTSSDSNNNPISNNTTMSSFLQIQNSSQIWRDQELSEVITNHTRDSNRFTELESTMMTRHQSLTSIPSSNAYTMSGPSHYPNGQTQTNWSRSNSETSTSYCYQHPRSLSFSHNPITDDSSPRQVSPFRHQWSVPTVERQRSIFTFMSYNERSGETSTLVSSIESGIMNENTTQQNRQFSAAPMPMQSDTQINCIQLQSDSQQTEDTIPYSNLPNSQSIPFFCEPIATSSSSVSALGYHRRQQFCGASTCKMASVFSVEQEFSEYTGLVFPQIMPSSSQTQQIHTNYSENTSFIPIDSAKPNTIPPIENNQNSYNYKFLDQVPFPSETQRVSYFLNLMSNANSGANQSNQMKNSGSSSTQQILVTSESQHHFEQYHPGPSKNRFMGTPMDTDSFGNDCMTANCRCPDCIEKHIVRGQTQKRVRANDNLNEFGGKKKKIPNILADKTEPKETGHQIDELDSPLLMIDVEGLMDEANDIERTRRSNSKLANKNNYKQ